MFILWLLNMLIWHVFDGLVGQIRSFFNIGFSRTRFALAHIISCSNKKSKEVFIRVVSLAQ